MPQNNAVDKERPEVLEFTATQKQLIGEPWRSINGELMQNILFADGWFLARPVKKLHETENKKVKFYLSTKKRDGSVNKISLKRSLPTGEVDGKGKPVYKQEKLVVSVEELPEILNYALEKYKFKKAQEESKKEPVEKERGLEEHLQSDIDFSRNSDGYQNEERFTVIDLGCSKFAIKDNKAAAFLMSEEKTPYGFTSEQMAQIFAEKANKIEQDGLAIRMYKDKEFALCKIAVQQNGLALAFIRNQSMELIQDALYQNPNAIVLVVDEYRDKAVELMPDMIFDKMLQGKVLQKEVMDHLFSLDDKADYSLCVLTETGKRYEVKAEDISVAVAKLTNGSCSYTVSVNGENISFTDKGIEEVQYKGIVAAFYDTAVAKEQLKQGEELVQPRRRIAKVI